MAPPVWVTPPGTLGTIPEGVFYSVPLVASAAETVYYQLIAGRLPPGIQINETGILSGNPQAIATVQGVPLDVTTDTISQFAVRAYTATKQLADRTFTITVTGQTTVVWTTPSGSIGPYYDGVQISGLVVDYSNPDIYSINVITLIAGALPPGLTISSAGVISGYIIPDVNTHTTKTTYSFTLKVSNGVSSDVRAFSILVYARSTMTADNTQLTADDTFVTADVTPVQPPIITTPTGSIGSTRSDNFYAFQFTGLEFDGNAFQFISITDLPPGLTLDPNSGWLYGYIPFGGVLAADYSFTLIAWQSTDHDNRSGEYDYTLTITGPVNSDVDWLTPSSAVERAKNPSSLGLIDNGATSTFYVEAVSVSGIPLQYQLVSGSDSRLPQGLQLLTSGHIAGRVSFDTFILDGGTTVFDVNLNTVDQPTTFDLVAIFTVNAFSVNGLIDVDKTFSITVVRRYEVPFSLKAGEFKQVWLTLEAPKTAEGIYSGTISISIDGKAQSAIPLEVRVLPFELPDPKTNYDLTREYYTSTYNHSSLGEFMKKNGGDPEKATTRLLNEYVNMRKHNVMYPMVRDLAMGETGLSKTMEVYKKAGLRTDAIIGAIPAIPGYDWMTSPEVKNNPIDKQPMPEDLIYKIDVGYEVMKKAVGHSNIYCFGWDEPGMGLLTAQRKPWKYLQDKGLKTYSTAHAAHLTYGGYNEDFVNYGGGYSKEASDKWHAFGGRITSYAAPHTGPENPDFVRRTHGMDLYMADCDGTNNYILNECSWNDFIGTEYNFRSFNWIYPGIEAPIDTIEWEGYREAIDDVRYATLLKQLANKAIATGKTENIYQGRMALQWLVLLDPKKCDLTYHRYS